MKEELIAKIVKIEKDTGIFNAVVDNEAFISVQDRNHIVGRASLHWIHT